MKKTPIKKQEKEKVGRPTTYKKAYVKLAKEYIDSCEDEFYKEVKSESSGKNSDSTGYELKIKVKLPTIEGLALHLNTSRSTLYLWIESYPEFSDIIDELQEKQANMLIEKGLSGDYNPTIAKVLLTKHGYREGVDATSGGEKLTAIPVTGVRVIIEK